MVSHPVSTPPFGASPHLQNFILKNVSDIMVFTDTEFRVQSWNRGAEAVYGIPFAQALGRRMMDLIRFTFLHTTREQAIADLHQHGIWQDEVSFVNKAGQTLYFSQTVQAVADETGMPIGFLAIGRNITDRVTAEQKIQESEQFYRALIADSSHVTLLLNINGDITFATPSVQQLLGFEAAELVGTNAFGYVHPEDLALGRKSFEREVEDKAEIKFVVLRLRRKNGDWLPCMVRGNSLLHIPSVGSIALYIDDDRPRQQMTRALRESEGRFRALVRDIAVGVLLQRPDGTIEMTNAAMCRLFAVPETDILGGRIWELYTDVIHEDGRVFLQSERPSFRAMQSRKMIRDVVMGVWHKKRQERVWILINAEPVMSDAGEMLNIVCSFIDITDRKKAEKQKFWEKVANQRQLAQATIDGQERERLDIGKELHDNIGQQLTTVKLFLDMAGSSAAVTNGEMIAAALKGVTGLIDEVRALSRSLVPPTLKDLGFVECINELLDSLRTTATVAVTVEYTSFDENFLLENKKLALFRIVQEQLNNILKHAAATQIHVVLKTTAIETVLEITDNGKGFDWNKIRRGLGLKNITNRAELFGGRVEINTAPGEGCSVRVSLPHSFLCPGSE